MRMRRAILLCVLGIFLFSGVSAGAAEPVTGGALRWYEQADPPMLDPHQATDTVSARVIRNIFENLVANSPDGQEVRPWLAEGWEVSADGLRWTFKLRRGVRFHASAQGGRKSENGGREVKAADWKWSFERMIHTMSPRAFFVDCIVGYQEMLDGKAQEWSGIRAVDDYTLEFTLREPFAPFLSVLAYNSFVVVPKEDAEKWGKEFNFHPVGTGPFVFEEWKHDRHVLLKKNPDYWRRDAAGDALPYLDEWRLVVIPDSTVAWEEFKKGNIDVMRDVPDQIVGSARELLGKKLIEEPQPGIYFYGFNCENGVFAEHPDLRRALNYAVNREMINEIVLAGLMYPAKGVLPPSMPGYDKDLKGYDFDPEKARALLKKAGFEKGVEVTLQVNQDARHKAVAEAIQAQIADLGVKMNIKVVDWGVHLDTLDRGEVEMFRMGWIVDYLDPDNFLYVNLHSANFGKRGNHAFYKNDQVDAWLAEARVETDQAKRVELYRLAERRIVDDAPWLFLFHYYSNLAAQEWINGAILPAFGSHTADMAVVWTTKK